MTVSFTDRWSTPTRLVSLKEVQAFAAVAQGGSFRAAAGLLVMDQSSVSRLVSALERDLGVTLFLRAPGGARLTVAGRALLDPCRALLEQARLLRADAAAFAAPQPGEAQAHRRTG